MSQAVLLLYTCKQNWVAYPLLDLCCNGQWLNCDKYFVVVVILTCFVCFKKKDGSWGNAKNLGSPVNTNYSDWYPTVTPDGKYLMFSRNIDGLADLMWVDAKIIDELRTEKE